jgi:hypothetical protein
MSGKTFFILLLFPLGMAACATMQQAPQTNSQSQALNHFVEEEPQQTQMVFPLRAYGPDPNESRAGAYAEKSPIFNSMSAMMKITPFSSAGQRISGESADNNDEGSVCIYCRHQL